MAEISERDLKAHWDAAYARRAPEKLGWYEAEPLPSLQLIERSGLDRDARILIAGAGATTLVDALLERGYRNIIANDISSTALQRLKERLGARAEDIHWVEDDLTHPHTLPALEPVDLWHDRAVLHFFTEAEDRRTYFGLLRRLVRPGGFVVLAAFNLQGAERCSGLPVHRYDAPMLAEALGAEFRLLESFDHVHIMPSGEERPYVYTLFERV